MALPEFSEVDDALSSGGSLVRAAECHGVLCGILCASGSADMQGWIRHLFESRDEKLDITANALRVLHDVHQGTLAEINHETFEFSLLLPSVDTAIEERINAVSEWCSGLSLGLSMGGLQDKMLSNDDVQEFIQDVQYIAEACFRPDTEEEDHTEESLAEIEEYLRVGVLLLNDELQPTAAASPTIH